MTTTTSVDPLLVAAGLKGTEGGTNSIVFSTNASGPSFGTVQLDAGLPSRPGYSVLNQIMVSAGFDADTVAAVDTASQQITQIKTYTQASAFGDTSGVNSQSLVVALTKQVEFIKIIGGLLDPDGSAAEQQTAGANVFENLNGAVQNSSQYINSVSSNQVDGITTQVSNIISNISNGGGNLGILGLPSSDQNYAAAVIAISDVINNNPAAVPGFLASLNAAATNGPITLATIYGAAPASLATTGWENSVWATAGSYSSGSSQYSSWYLPADSRVSSPTFLTPINYNPDASDDAADYYDQLAESDNTGDVLQSDTALVFNNGGVYSVLGLGALPQVFTLSGLATPPSFDAAGNLDATFAVGSSTATVALNPTTGAVVNDPTAVTAPLANGQTVTLLGLGGPSPFALISNDNSITAGAVSSNDVLYTGEAIDLADRLSGHERMDEAKRCGATRLLVHTPSPGSPIPYYEVEERLIKTLHPPMNTQHNNLLGLINTTPGTASELADALGLASGLSGLGAVHQGFGNGFGMNALAPFMDRPVPPSNNALADLMRALEPDPMPFGFGGILPRT